MENAKIEYKWTARFNPDTPNQGFDEIVDSVIVETGTTAEQWLTDSGIEFSKCGDDVYVVTNGKNPNEAFKIVSIKEGAEND